VIPAWVGSHFPGPEVTTPQPGLGSRSSPDALKARGGRCCSWWKTSKDDLRAQPLGLLCLLP